MSETITKIKVKTDIKEPSLYNVVYYNDNETTGEFVVKSLLEFFSKTEKESIKLTEDVHVKGLAVVGTFSHEIAEQKASDVILSARSQGFPFVVKAEKN